MDKDLQGKTREDLEKVVVGLGQKRYLAGYLFKFIQVQNGRQIAGLSTLSKAFRAQLVEQGYFISQLQVVETLTAPDGSAKAAAAVPIRTVPEKRGRQRLAEERAMVNALAGKRDPFKVPPPPKIGGGKDDPTDGPMLPGVRGLVIGQLRLKGIVREEDSHTMIAVVSNGSNLAYFLHIHEDVYNGVVSRITPDAIYFLQKHPDSGGRLEAREVVLKLVSRGQEAR